MVKIALIIFGLLIVQGILTFFQIKNYRNNISEIRKKGRLLIGQQKGRMKAGSIILMALDDNGCIIDSRAMTGITVFHRFRKINELINKNINFSEEWIDSIKNSQTKKAMNNAIEAMNNQIEEANKIND